MRERTQGQRTHASGPDEKAKETTKSSTPAAMIQPAAAETEFVGASSGAAAMARPQICPARPTKRRRRRPKLFTIHSEMMLMPKLTRPTASDDIAAFFCPAIVQAF